MPSVVTTSRHGVATDEMRQAFVGDSAPNNPTLGTLWYDTDLTTLRMWDGSIWVDTAELKRLMDGAIVETIDIDVIEDTGTIKLQLQQEGGGDLTCKFAGVAYTLDTTPVLEVNLTAGTDTVPQLNYIYITESSGVLALVNDTSAFPATAHCPVATVLCQTAASLATDGAYKVHAWTDHFNKSTENGHIAHLNARIRAQNARWVSGCAAGDMAVSDPDAYIDIAAGVVFQLHTHTMPAIDMQTPAPVFLVNDPTTAFKRITTFDDITQDASSGAINNKYMNLVLWGCVSENESECKLFINLPTGTDVVEATAQTDENQYSVYAFPVSFVGTAFLIARYTVQAKDSGAWVQSQKVDLRGQFPSSAAGSGAGVTDHGNLAGLTDNDHTQYILHSLADDKGDILGASADDTFAKLTVGSNGQVLTADSGEATGMKWASALSAGDRKKDFPPLWVPYPTLNEEYPLTPHFNEDMTLVKIQGVIEGGTSVELSLFSRTLANTFSGTSEVTMLLTKTFDTGGDTYESGDMADTDVDAGELIWMKITGVTGTVTGLILSANLEDR